MKRAAHTVWRWLRAAHLRWHISSTEQYMAACERDGIMGTDTLRHWQRQLAADRVRLALLEMPRCTDRLPRGVAR